MNIHQPVLTSEVMEYLNPQLGSFIVDGTVNGGGHAEHILAAIGGTGSLLGVDWDGEMIRKTRKKFSHIKNLKLVEGNYADLPHILERQSLPQADGLLLDLGFSSMQLVSGRGFSYREDEPLLMTYSDNQKPLRDVIATLSEEDIAQIIREFGEERFARRIAQAIYRREQEDPIRTSGELAKVIESAVSRPYEGGRMHPATRTFQAFRIYINQELENLKKVLSDITTILASGGRVVIISFHSLEDRVVKHEFKKLKKQGRGNILTKKPIQASEAEAVKNPRARSAKLRAFQVA